MKVIPKGSRVLGALEHYMVVDVLGCGALMVINNAGMPKSRTCVTQFDTVHFLSMNAPAASVINHYKVKQVEI